VVRSSRKAPPDSRPRPGSLGAVVRHLSS
jgi:hypothetical protein